MKIKSIFQTIIILIITLIIFPQPVISLEKTPTLAWKKGGVIINDSQGKSIKQNPSIAECSDGTFVIVWEDARNGYLDIYAQKVDRNGEILWGENGVAVCTAPKNQSFPQIALVEKNNIIVVWQDYRNIYSDIYAQKLDGNGIPLWENDGISICKADANQMAPKLAPDGSGGAIITWHDYRGGKGEDIYAQKVRENGSLAWKENGIAVCTAEGTQWYPKIISDDSGGAIIVWDDKRSDFYDIYAQRINNDGKALWTENGFPICLAPDNQEYSEMAKNSDGFVIIWQDQRSGNSDIYAQKINAAGKLFWKVDGIEVCDLPGNQEKPKITEGKEVIITWEDYRNGLTNPDIYAQKIKDDGKISWDKNGVVVCETKERQESPNIISDNKDGAMIYWKDYRTSEPSIYYAKISKDGKFPWVKDGLSVCKSLNAENPRVVLSNDDSFTIVWQDKRGGNTNIFAQSVSPFGDCLWQTDGITLCASFGNVTQQKPRIAKVGNKNEYVIIWEDYRNGFSNIYAQKVNNNGETIWNRESVRTCMSGGNQTDPRITGCNDGSAIIAWQDNREKYTNIYIQKIDDGGKLVWGKNALQVAPYQSNQHDPEISTDDSGGAIITWADDRDETKSGSNIYAQKIDSTGSRIWRKEGNQVCGAPELQTEQKIMKDGEGGAIIAWTDFRRSLKNSDIYAQRISSSGDPLWGKDGISFCKAPDIQRNPEIAGNDTVILAWEDSGSGNYDIYAQKFDRNGKIGWTIDGIEVCSAGYTQHDPRLVYDNNGGVVIVWEDYRNINWDIYAQRLGMNGTRLWDINSVPVCAARSTQYSPQLIINKAGNAIIVWEDYRNEKNYNLFAMKLSPGGKYLWDENGIPINPLSNEGARDPNIVTDGEDGAIIVWTDFRYGNYDIYAQRIIER